MVFADNYNLPSEIKANAVLTYTDINTYEEGLYTATFVTMDESGNESTPYTLYVMVSRTELPTGVEELDLADMLTVAPNPTTGQFAITIDLAQNEDITVDVFNSMGQKVAEVVNIISKSAKTGEIGDGKIFVYSLQNVVRIRTGEKNEEAIK